eukprot:gene17778-biopygen6829
MSQAQEITQRPQLSITITRDDFETWQRLMGGSSGVCGWMPWGLKLTEATMQLKEILLGSFADNIDEAHSCVGKVLVRVNGRPVASPGEALKAAESCDEVRLQFAGAPALSAGFC